jgi:hypothetical protein
MNKSGFVLESEAAALAPEGEAGPPPARPEYGAPARLPGLTPVGFERTGGSMAEELRQGDRVEWSFRGRKVVGRVRRRLTSRTIVNDRVVAASKDDPRYLVVSEKSGKETTRRPQSLRKLP